VTCTDLYEFAHCSLFLGLPPVVEFLEIVEHKSVSIVGISGSVRLLRIVGELLGRGWLRLLLETDRERRDRGLDLERGLAGDGLGREGLLLLRVVRGELGRMGERVEGLLDWRV
jgi:hypothetical protein